MSTKVLTQVRSCKAATTLKAYAEAYRHALLAASYAERRRGQLAAAARLLREQELRRSVSSI